MEQLLTNIKKTDEVIIVNDACENINTIQYLNKLSENSSQLKIVHLSKKVGFAKANNIGIAHSIGETLIFINSDIFLTNNCIENMLNLLWSNNKIGAVQPKLIYPQNNLIQSTGHIFLITEVDNYFLHENLMMLYYARMGNAKLLPWHYVR